MQSCPIFYCGPSDISHDPADSVHPPILRVYHAPVAFLRRLRCCVNGRLSLFALVYAFGISGSLYGRLKESRGQVSASL